MSFLEFLNSINDLEPVKSYFDLKITLKIVICDEINHDSVKSKISEV